MPTDVKVENIRKSVISLERCKNRSYTEVGNERASDYIRCELRKYGYDVRLDRFTYRGRTYHNIIAEMRVGESPKNYLVCAHFDSNAMGRRGPLKRAPGADDNASGVAALLELGRILCELKPRVNVSLVFFNLEEEKQMGSKHLARKFARGDVRIDGVINLDTIGTWEGAISRKLPVNYISDERSAALLKLMRRHFPHPIERAKGFWQDDHASFWKEGYEAIELTENGCSKYIHTMEDTHEKLHYGNIARIADGLGEFLTRID